MIICSCYFYLHENENIFFFLQRDFRHREIEHGNKGDPRKLISFFKISYIYHMAKVAMVIPISTASKVDPGFYFILKFKHMNYNSDDQFAGSMITHEQIQYQNCKETNDYQ